MAVAADTTRWEIARTASVLLAGRSCCARRMAHSRDIYTWAAIGSVAPDRARVLSCDRASVLVAGDSALAERRQAGLVHHCVSLSCHVALRHHCGITCVRRTCGLFSLFFLIADFWPFCARRPAVRGRANVDVRHSCVSRGGCNSHYAVTVAAQLARRRVGAIGMAWQCDDARHSAEPGGSLSNGH